MAESLFLTYFGTGSHTDDPKMTESFTNAHMLLMLVHFAKTTPGNAIGLGRSGWMIVWKKLI